MSWLSKHWSKTPMSKAMKAGEKIVSKAIPHAHSADVRAQRALVAEQIESYRTQKADMDRQTAELKEKKDRAQYDLNRKTVKAAQHNYRKPGFMGSNDGLSDKMGV